jgi:SAM-dependent methyltransferase
MMLPLEVLQNMLMALPPIARLAQRFHSTGVNTDFEGVHSVYEFYTRFVPVEGKDVLEIGPGHTLEVLERATKAGAKSCTAVDVIEYVSAARAKEAAVDYHIYNGKKLPFEPARFDIVWSYTAFEHLRYPAMTVAECYRVLRDGGRLIAFIDLGDHSYYGGKEIDPLKLFDCLRYPQWLWNLMRWNRSSYVNRLRKSDWQELFKESGFVCRHEESRSNEAIVRALPALRYLHRYSHDDATTSVMTVCLEKQSRKETA